MFKLSNDVWAVIAPYIKKRRQINADLKLKTRCMFFNLFTFFFNTVNDLAFKLFFG